MKQTAQSAGRWDGKHWLNGTAGNCNIVTYNGEDVVGVGYIANDNAREQVIADHNARLDAQSADVPSDESFADVCANPAHDHECNVVEERRAIVRSCGGTVPEAVSEAEIEEICSADNLQLHIGELTQKGVRLAKAAAIYAARAALEAAARVRADHCVDANKIEGDAK